MAWEEEDHSAPAPAADRSWCLGDQKRAFFLSAPECCVGRTAWKKSRLRCLQGYENMAVSPGIEAAAAVGVLEKSAVLQEVRPITMRFDSVLSARPCRG